MVKNRQKKSVVFFIALVLHVSLYPITENQAYLGAALISLASTGVAVCNSNDSSVVAGAGALSLALAYASLRQLTPRVRLAKAQNILDEIENDPFANTFPLLVSEKATDEEFEKTVNSFYQHNIEKEIFPLVIAFNTITGLKPHLEKAGNLIRAARCDSGDDVILQKLLSDLESRCGNYRENVRNAIARIVGCEKYSKNMLDYKNMQANDRKLELDERNATSKERIAGAQEENAHAKTRTAGATESFTFLKWLKWIAAFLCGK